MTLTANPDFEAKASYSFNVIATDAAGNAATQAVTLAITNLDEVAPTITSGNTATAINENSGAGQVIYTATSTDSGDTASGSTSYSLSGADAGLFSIDASSGAVTLTANPDFEAKASYSFNVIATDAAGNAATQAVTLAVINLNEFPTVTNPMANQIANEDSTFSFQFAANTFHDVDSGDSLTYSAQLSGGGVLPAWLSFNAATRTFSGTPTNADVGSLSIDVIADDGNGGTVTDSFSLVVANINDAPTISPVTLSSIKEDSGIRLITQDELLVNSNDIDNDTLTVTDLSIISGNGILVNNGNGTWYYSPALDDDTTVSFGYQISDGQGGTVVGNATMDITPVNDTPTLNDSTTITTTSIVNNKGTVSYSVESILARSSWGDVDNTSKGIAVTSVSGQGIWEYSVDGTKWLSFGDVSLGKSLLLESNTLVRFIPQTTTKQTAVFSFKAWDQSSYLPSNSVKQSYADLNAGASSSAFSSGSASMNVNIIQKINDPTLVNIDLESLSNHYFDENDENDKFFNNNKDLLDNISSNESVTNRISNESYSDSLIISDLSVYLDREIKKLDYFKKMSFEGKLSGIADSITDETKQVSGNWDEKNKLKANVIFKKRVNHISEQVNLDILENAHKQFDDLKLSDIDNKVEVEILLGTSVALTAGYVSWILRGGALMASFLSAIPLFKRFDPVPILRDSIKRQTSSDKSNEDEQNDTDSDKAVSEIADGE